MIEDDSETQPPDGPPPLDTGIMTWAALLARWTDLVGAGEGLRRLHPGDADVERWRESIPEIISLQAITFALGELERIPWEDRSIARDRADLGVGKAAQRLDGIWRGIEMPPSLLEIAADARHAVEQAVYVGLQWIRVTGNEPVRMPSIDLETDPGIERGTLALAQPGTLMLPGSPLGWFTERPAPDGLEAVPVEHVPGPAVQVYRMLDEQGRVEHDLVASLRSLPAGLPLLVPITLDGRRIGRWLVDAEDWSSANDRAFAAVERPELVFEDGTRPVS